jgi:AAA family ATP:ADP antiporter
MGNLLLIFLPLKVSTPEQNIWAGRIFFIWTSVFNLFVVSVFWALMVDVFDAEQGKRLFGVISAGATLGSILGSSLTATLARHVGSTALLLGQVGAWSYALLSGLGLSVTGIALAAVPLSAAWLLNGFWLGREQEAMAAASEPLSWVPVQGPSQSG